MFNNLLDFVFPSLCVICERVNPTGLCKDCLSSLPSKQLPFSCYPCKRSFFGVHACAHMYPLDGLMPVLPYQRRRVKHSIQMYKYYRVRTLATPLARHMRDRIATLPEPFAPPKTVAYVPLHQKRLLTRGFNQAHLLGVHLADHYQVPLDERLYRAVSTAPQMSLASTARASNMRGVFQSSPGHPSLREPVLLVDDVATTLATLRACASVLKAEGATAVYGFPLAA